MNRQISTAVRRLQRQIWSMLGGRRFSAFGEHLSVEAQTELPQSRWYRLPRNAIREKMLRYTDHVQMRSACNFLGEFSGSPVVVEVGAYTGAYATILGSIIKRKNGRMLAIEPDPANCAQLRKNIARNGLQNTVIVEQVAASDCDGEAKMAASGTESTIGHAGANAITVQTATLRTILARNQLTKVDLLIIDVEGAELPALRGFPWESITPQCVFCELHAYAWPDFGYSASDLERFFADHNYLPLDMFFRPWPKLPGPDPDGGYLGPTFLAPLSPTPRSGD